MATARKKTTGGKPAKPAPKAKAGGAKAKPAPKKPAPKPAKAAKSAPKPVAKPAPKASAKPAPKPAAKPAAKAPAKVVGKPAVKSAAKPVAAKPGAAKPGAAKPAPKVIGKPAVKGAAKPAPAPPPAKPVPKAPPRLVPATADARAAHLAQSKAAKTTSGKPKLVVKAPPEVRPLGVLPPEAMARPKTTAIPPRPKPGVTPPRPQHDPKPAAKKGDDRLTEADLKHFEERLQAERARIMKELGHIDSTLLKVNPKDSAGELSGYSFHMADAGTDSMEREKAFDIASKEGRLLLEIDDALRRLYNGVYGICESSGKPISRARLEALPWARYTIEEQERFEREQRAGRAAAPGIE